MAASPAPASSFTKTDGGSARKNVPTPYKAWCQAISPHRTSPRELIFQTAGRAPLNLPPHPARLTPIRQMAKTAPPGVGFTVHPLATPQQMSSTAPDVGFSLSAGVTAEPVILSRDIPKDFAGECCRVVSDQNGIGVFDVHKVLHSCALFRLCSPGFLQELTATGGAPAYHGRIIESGSVLYSEGELGASMFVIVRGTVSLTCHGAKELELEYSSDWPSKMQLKFQEFSWSEGREIKAVDRHGAKLNLTWSAGCPELRDVEQKSFPLKFKASAGLATVPRFFGPGEVLGVAQGLGIWNERQETATAGTSVHVLEVTLSALTATLSVERETLRDKADDIDFHLRVPKHRFAQERRHFEYKARLLNADLRRQRLKSKGRIAAVLAAEEEGSEASPHGTENQETGFLRRSSSGGIASEPKSLLSKLGGKSPKRRPPAISSEEGEAPAAVLSPSGGASTVVCLQHPRKWRMQVQKKQAELEYGVHQHHARDHFLQRLNSSIRQDFFNGHQQPVDSPLRYGGQTSGQGAAEEVTSSRPLTSGGERDIASGLEEEDEGDESGAGGGMLDLNMLPAFTDMSSKQKIDLLKHMSEQNKAANSPKKHVAHLQLPHSARSTAQPGTPTSTHSSSKRMDRLGSP
eukprot:TRINITY_DN29877_c0_g1_i1.p1 TRINITY_DN29877_c0_g1~~TRINITY_DN29877_c0_g1_i1.p1  ORF type:complete len:644 (+),score=133.15 TRINITY_DN29877_c0_g1_i1:35-1933(+)